MEMLRSRGEAKSWQVGVERKDALPLLKLERVNPSFPGSTSPRKAGYLALGSVLTVLLA